MNLNRKVSTKVIPYLEYVSSQLLIRGTCKIAVNVESSVLERLENDQVKHREHPGIIKTGQIELPVEIKSALNKLIKDHPMKALLRDCLSLNQYINARHPPQEIKDVRTKMREIVKEVDSKMPPEKLAALNEIEGANWRRKREQIINRLISQRTYAWKPITYGPYEALVYAIGRGAQEYAVLVRILNELKQRDPDFQPRSFFDFGSGVGSGMWASSNFWKNSIYEYYNVDKSREMNDLSELILRNGNENQQITVQNVFYRQFLPGIETKYDLIISSHSLFELTSAQNRKDVMLNLWQKCSGYLIIAEEGTRRGTELVNEAREYLLNLEEEELKGHVVAPCPHDDACPRLASLEDRTPCNFELSYVPFEVSSNSGFRQTARYSYVVLKKGKPQDDTLKWPRLVRPTLIRSKHVICRMCTADAKLQEIIFTRSKHGRSAFRCAKASNWGDRLPISIGGPLKTEKKSREVRSKANNETRTSQDIIRTDV